MDLDRVTRQFAGSFERVREALVAGFRGPADEGRRRCHAIDVLNRLMFACFTGSPEAWQRPQDVRQAVCGTAGRTVRPSVLPPLTDELCRQLLDFARGWRWRLADGPPDAAGEITPDVLGLILEQHVNQRQTGSYYTRPDVTRYIAQATILPALLDAVAERFCGALGIEAALRRQLAEQPVRYLRAALRKGAIDDAESVLHLPSAIAAGVECVAVRESWNEPADAAFRLPGETWRDVMARRDHCLHLYDSLRNGAACVDDLVTWNLDLGRLVADMISAAEDPRLPAAFHAVLTGRPRNAAAAGGRLRNESGRRAGARRPTPAASGPFRVLDPTCGCGAFLIAALDVLEPVYEACFAPLPDGVRPSASLRHSIIARNLCGVDLLPEAVELCRLRLRLKAIEAARRPLSRSALANVLRLRDNLHVGDALAGPVGVPQQSGNGRHGTNGSPFDWSVAFRVAVAGGGFDVVIGNPPYVETRGGRDAFSQYAVARTGNLFALCTERSIELLRPGGRLGVILPMSCVSTPRMRPLMELACDRLAPVWLSHFACRPGKLFAGVDMNVTIVLGRKHAAAEAAPALYTTGYQRWSTRSRPFLFETLHYTPAELLAARGTIPKLNSRFERKLLEKLLAFAADGRLRSDASVRNDTGSDAETVYYHSGGRYFRKCLRQKLSNEYKPLVVPAGWGDAAVCLLSSSLFYWLWIALSDCYHVTDRDLRYLPLADSLAADPDLSRLAERLLDDLWARSEARTRRRADGTTQQEVNFDVSRSRPLLDEIDRVLARHFGLSDAELEFVLTYDLRHRLPAAT